LAQQQQHCIGLTEFLIPAGKSLPNRDPRVQLLKSFDRSKDFDEWAVGSDAILFERFSRQRDFHRAAEGRLFISAHWPTTNQVPNHNS